MNTYAERYSQPNAQGKSTPNNTWEHPGWRRRCSLIWQCFETFEGMAKERISNPGDPKRMREKLQESGTWLHIFWLPKGTPQKEKAFLFMMGLI
jgi:hypothetical protein